MFRKTFGACVLFGLMTSAHANLIVNGGFELPGPSGGTYEAVGGSGNTAIANWSTVYSGVEWFKPATYNPGWGSACEGDFCIDLNYVTASNGGLEQSFATTQHAFYKISFCAATLLDEGRTGTGLVCATMGDYEYDLVVTNTTSVLNWNQYSFVAQAGFSVSTLRFFTVLDSTQYFAFVDDVKVELVPEPGTLCALGLGAAVLSRRRRKS